MKTLALIFSLLIWNSSAMADILYIDLNNAPMEYTACQKGAGEENVHVLGPITSNGKKITSELIDQKISQLERAGIKIDSIAISGHDGVGHFFGTYGQFYASELRDILNRHPVTRENAKTLGLFGCYTTNVKAAENYWVKPAPSIEVAMGYGIQSPLRTNADNASFVQEFCKKRVAAAKAAERNDECDFFKNLRSVGNLSAGICSQEIVASNDYGGCYSYRQLHQKCAEFDPGKDGLTMYEKYLNGEPGYENPPVDGGSASDGGGKNVTALRRYYNQVQLWGHCEEQLSQSSRGYDMPSPSQIIRLIFYDNLKNNLLRLNAQAFKDYNDVLTEMGGQDYTLDLKKMSRGETVRRLENAITAIGDVQARAQKRGDYRGAKRANAALTMAMGMYSTLVNLDYSCSNFELVEPSAHFPSSCLLTRRQVGL